MKRLALAVLVVAPLAACRSDHTLHPGPSAAILDATHEFNGQLGNPFFFWLSPMVNQQPPATMVFSRQLRPVVTITNEGPAASATAADECPAGTLVRPPFSGADLSISEAAYHVNWRTSQDALNANCTYRITVTAGSEVLGFADVDVVNSGRELKDVATGEFIPLLDDRTLPIRFFAGVGSQCGDDVADCGEGVAVGGENTTIVTTSGRAGVFIPGDALPPGQEVTITVESVDERTESGECIPGLPNQFPGIPGSVDNGCYDYHAVPVGSRIEQASGRFTFETPVTVGICPPVDAAALEHEFLDRLQIFQFDEFGEGETSTLALPNVPAPFLRCDPEFSPTVGARRSLLGDLARAFAAIIVPQPLYASSRSMMFDLGAGGSAEGFSRFTWGLPSEGIIDFERFPDGSAACGNCVITDQFAARGIEFAYERFDEEFTGATLGDGNNLLYGDRRIPWNQIVTSPVTAEGAGISGVLTMTMVPPYPRTVRFDWSTPPEVTPPLNVFTGNDESGESHLLPPSAIRTTFLRNYTNSAGHPVTWRQVEVSSELGIQRIVFIMTGVIQQIDNVERVP